MILSSLGSNLLLKDRKLEISLEKPILLIKEINDSLKGNEAENSPLEPAEVPIKKGTYSVSNAINPLVLREQGPNLQPVSPVILFKDKILGRGSGVLNHSGGVGTLKHVVSKIKDR